jgi:hypothetical protein
MQLGGLIRSTGFGPAESFACWVSPAFDRRGAHPAWSPAAHKKENTKDAIEWILNVTTKDGELYGSLSPG